MTYQPNIPNRISTTSFNSRDAATLAADATFQGVGEDVSSYGRVGVSIISSNQASGTLFLEVSRDNITWTEIERDFSDTREAKPHMKNIVEQFFRIRYVNGRIEAEDLLIQVQYSTNSNIFLGYQLDEELIDETEATVTRSILLGRSIDGDYHNVDVNEAGVLQVGSVEIVNLLEQLIIEQKLTNAYLKSITGGEMVEVRGG